MNPDPAGSNAERELLRRRTTCRGCGGTRLQSFLSLGEFPLANSFLAANQLQQPEPRFPLEVFFCRECSLVQLLHVVDPRVLFSNYIYRTGTNETIKRHNAALAAVAVDSAGLTEGDLVMEIASNDGSLLQEFRARGFRTLGIEPAKNIAETARQAGIETLDEFFELALAERIRRERGPARLVIANNVLAHVDAPVDFLAGCRSLVESRGWVIVEVPYLGEMVSRLEYDTIYHEHLCYFSVTALMNVFARAGLSLEHIDLVEIHGGSLRLWARLLDESGHADSVHEMAAKEERDGLTRLEIYDEFAARVACNREQLREMLRALHASGATVAGYGAPAKGNTLLCYCEIGTDLIPYTVDRSPLKLGMYTPGMHIPVFPVDRIFAERPDYVLLLAWNFAPEITQFLRPYAERGGRFILPIPKPSLV